MRINVALLIALVALGGTSAGAQTFYQDIDLSTPFGQNPYAVSNAFLRIEDFSPHVRYWQPSAANVWGEVTYRFDVPFHVNSVELYAPASVYTVGGPANFDPDAEAHIEVSIDNFSWNEIYSALPGNVPSPMPKDVSSLVQGTDTIYVRARLRMSTDYDNFGTSQFIRNVPPGGGFIRATSDDIPAIANVAVALGASGSPVERFYLESDGDIYQLPYIYPRAESTVFNPIATAFNEFGELFIANRERPGSISRYHYDAQGNRLSNGLITGNGLDFVHGLAFSPTGELFAANYHSGTVSRFKFDNLGNVIPNGEIPGIGFTAVGVAFSPSGELFAGNYDEIHRFLIDPLTGDAVPNGSFSIPGVHGLHFMDFSAAGELFVAALDAEAVYRFLFDINGQPVAHGSIPVRHAIGIAFSSAGELFVTSHDDVGGIHRFIFDEDGNAIPNGFVDTGGIAGDLAISPVPEPSGLFLGSTAIASLIGMVAAVRRRRSQRPAKVAVRQSLA